MSEKEGRDAQMRILSLLSTLLHERLLGHDGVTDGIITGFVCLVEYVNQNGEPSWSYFGAPDQRLFISLGLAEFLAKGLEADAMDCWQGLGEEDG